MDGGDHVKPAPFDYILASDLDDAVRALADADGDGRILAGGQSLVPLQAMRQVRPTLLVDVNRIEELGRIRPTESGVHLGATVRHAALVAQRRHPLLAEAASWIGHAAIRTRGTVGGSLAHADPVAELPVAALAAGAVIHASGPAGARTMPIEELFVAPSVTTLAAAEVLTGIDVPFPDRWGFAEFGRRYHDRSLLTVAVCDIGGSWRIAVGGVAGTPVRLGAAEARLTGRLDDARIADAAHAAMESVTPEDDLCTSGAHRRALTFEMVRRALIAAVGRTQEKGAVG